MATKTEPRACAENDVTAPEVLAGPGECFTGYGVMGIPFDSGHYLALRHWPSSSIGPGYRAVWHRDPDGRWTVYADAPPEVSCARYLGAALTAARTTPVRLAWTGPRSLTIDVPDVLTWQVEIGASAGTRLMSSIGALLPARTCRAPWLLRSMGVASRPVLAVGRIRLHGAMPNGQTFGALPRRVWRITASAAAIGGLDAGSPGRLPEQERLGDLMLPQRGVFFAHAAAVFVGP